MKVPVWPIELAGGWGVFDRKLEENHSILLHVVLFR